MESIPKISVLAAFLCCSSIAWSEGLYELREKKTGIQQLLVKQEASIRESSEKLGILSKRIRDQKENKTWVRNFKLESTLQEAQKVSNRLHEFTREHSETQKTLDQIELALMSALDMEIERLRNEPKQGSHSPNRHELAVKLDELTTERMSLGQRVDQATPSFPQGSYSNSTPDELLDRLNALRDMEKHLFKEVSETAAELSKLKRQQFVQNEVTQLFDEETLFSEQGFVRSGVRNNLTKEPENASKLGLPAGKSNPASPTALPPSDLPALTEKSSDESPTPFSLPPDKPLAGMSLKETLHHQIESREQKLKRLRVSLEGIREKLHTLEQQISAP